MFDERGRGYLAECFWPGVGEQMFADALARAQEAVARLRGEGREIDLRGAILVGSDETVFCLFAGDEPDVRAAGVLAGVRFERVLETIWFGAQAETGEEEG
jgi:hypothetical protein